MMIKLNNKEKKRKNGTLPFVFSDFLSCGLVLCFPFCRLLSRSLYCSVGPAIREVARPVLHLIDFSSFIFASSHVFVLFVDFCILLFVSRVVWFRRKIRGGARGASTGGHVVESSGRRTSQARTGRCDATNRPFHDRLVHLLLLVKGDLAGAAVDEQEQTADDRQDLEEVVLGKVLVGVVFVELSKKELANEHERSECE